MTEDWNLRDYILTFTHRWQVIIVVFLVGSLAGWGAGYVLPAPYRADTSIYIGFNADLILRNPDDYKNWYLGQLEAFIVSDVVLEQVIDGLHAQDSYWFGVEIGDIRPKLSTYWRNAGRWRLVAEWTDQEHAFQLAQAWANAVLSSTSQAISEASKLIQINAEFNAASNSLVETNLMQQAFSQIRSALARWQESLSSENTTTPLRPLERWRLQSLAASLVELNPVYMDLLAQTPALEAPAEDYQHWVAQLISTADNQLTLISEQSASLEKRIAELQANYQDTIDTSHGLSAYLVVELFEDTTMAKPIRRSDHMALVGGLIGLLGYAFWGLVRQTRMASQ